MQKNNGLELFVGLFLLMGLGAFAYIATQYGEFSFLDSADTYSFSAEFSNVSGLKKGALISMAGVHIGKVSGIKLSKDDLAVVDLTINNEVKISEDAIASVKTAGIIGDKYIKITQGGDDTYMESGGYLSETESTVDLEDIISQFVFGKV